MRKEDTEYKVDVLRKLASAEKKAHIGISLHNAKQSGEKLDTLLTWASQKYPNVQIDLYDDIHAYNILAEKNVTYTEAISLAREMSAKWITQNKPILAKFQKIQIHNYADLSRPFKIEERIAALHKLYKENIIFRNLIDADVSGYITRQEKRASKLSQERKKLIKNLSIKYIIDELALMSLLNEQDSFVEIYAGRFLGVLTDPRRHQIKDLPEGLKYYPLIEVDFIRQSNQLIQPDAA